MPRRVAQCQIFSDNSIFLCYNGIDLDGEGGYFQDFYTLCTRLLLGSLNAKSLLLLFSSGHLITGTPTSGNIDRPRSAVPFAVISERPLLDFIILTTFNRLGIGASSCLRDLLHARLYSHKPDQFHKWNPFLYNCPYRRRIIRSCARSNVSAYRTQSLVIA